MSMHATKRRERCPRGRSSRRSRAEPGQALCRGGLLLFQRVPQDIPTAPYGFDVVLAAGRQRELLAQLADEDVDDLEFRLIHSAVEMIEEIGRASCRESVCQYVYFSVVTGSLKKPTATKNS